MKCLFKHECYETGYAELSEKVTVFMKYLLVKKVFFWKSNCSEDVPAAKNYMFWIITHSGEKAPPKQQLCWNFFIFKK